MSTGRRRVLVAAMTTAAFAISSLLKAQAREEDDEPVFDPGDGITAPKVIHQVNPKPDSGTKGFKITGAVLIGLIVNSRGLPVNVHVVRSIEKEIDASAVEAVQEWRFEPGRKAGRPVAVRVTVEIRFHDL